MASLRAVLAEIYATPLSMAERRRLGARAIALCMVPSSRSDDPEGHPSAPMLYETALDQAGYALGLPGKASVSVAKATLREAGTGGAQLAARLGRISKARNACVHDVTLPSEIARCLAGLSSSADTLAADLTEEFNATFSVAFVPDMHFVWEPKPSFSDVVLQAEGITAANCNHPSIASTAVMVVPSATFPAAWEVCEPVPETAAAAAAAADDIFMSQRGAYTDTSDGTDTSVTASAPGHAGSSASIHPGRLAFLNTLSKAELRLMSESWDLPRGGGRHILIQRILAQLAAPNEG